MAKWCIDPGHGGVQPGATNNGINEKDITLAISLEVSRHLLRHKQEVIYTRTTDIDVSLSKRCEISNNNNCHYFVSIHCNSYSDTNVGGTETYCYKKEGAAFSLANYVQQELIAVNGLENRGVKTANYQVLVYTNAPAILIETAFLSNPKEFALLTDVNWQKKIAIAIAKGLLHEVGVQWIEENETDILKKKIADIQRDLDNANARVLVAERALAQMEEKYNKLIQSLKIIKNFMEG